MEAPSQRGDPENRVGGRVAAGHSVQIFRTGFPGVTLTAGVRMDKAQPAQPNPSGSGRQDASCPRYP